MIKLTKNVLGAGAAAAALVSMSVPAQAQVRYDRNDRNERGGISAGEVIAGVVVLGGIAAVLASKNNNDRYDNRYDDRDYRGDDRYNGRYDNRDDRRQAAADQCIRDVERNSSRYNRIKVTEIRDIDRTRDGFRVRGKIAVQDRNSRWGREIDNRRYDRGYDRGYEQASFTCTIERGRVVDIDVNGRRNWR